MLILSLVIIWAVIGEVLKRHKQEIKRHWLFYQRLRKMENQIINEYSAINRGEKNIVRALNSNKQVVYYQIPYIFEDSRKILQEDLGKNKRINFISSDGFVFNSDERMKITNNSFGSEPKSEMRKLLMSIREDVWNK